MPGGPCEGRPNPIAGVPRRKVEKKPHEVLRLDEGPKVLAEISDKPNPRNQARGKPSRCLNPRAICATALFTGMRKGELGGLRRADVDLVDGTIRVCRSWDAPRTKDGKFSLIPIAKGLRPYLEAVLRDAPGEFVFPAEGGGMMPRDVDLKGILRRAAGRAVVVVGYEARCRRHLCGYRERRAGKDVGKCPRCGYQLWAKALPRKLRFHDTRRTAATLLLKDGVLLRHSDPKLTSEIYGHLELEAVRHGVERLDFGPAQVTPAEVVPAPVLALAASAEECGRAAPVLWNPQEPKDEAPEVSEEPSNSGAFTLSGRLDLNQRPLAPKASALPGCATPRFVQLFLDAPLPLCKPACPARPASRRSGGFRRSPGHRP
jgi:integrase